MNSQCSKISTDGESSKRKRTKNVGKSGVEMSGKRKTQQQQSRFRALREDELQGPPSRTRASLKRRLHEPSLTKVLAENKSSQEDRSRNGDKTHIIEPKESTRTDLISEEQLGALSITQTLPDKQTLELIIDTLQRKDIYEIFAEPVDPEEVRDYYEIIEEPMDFGTMRAKLHEGMYTSLEQFEHDVFLIPGNAMHFNSSGTIFFRQAHGIDKLAKRVFHVLRTNPENFESEFAGNRRRFCRRSNDETDELNGKLFSKTSEKRGGRGGRDGKRCDSIELDRRSTYKPELNFNNEKWSKSLIHLNQHENSYSESLMKFVKDLGPTAQMVANRKLQNLNQNHQTTIRDFSNQTELKPGTMWLNSYRSDFNDRIVKTDSIITHNRIDCNLDLRSMNHTDRDESSVVTHNRINRCLDLRSLNHTGGDESSVVTHNRIDRDISLRSLNHTDRDGSSGNGTLFMSYSGERMNSPATSTVIPAWLRQIPCSSSRFTLDLGFLKSKMGKMNNCDGEFEETGSNSYKPSDVAKDLALQL